MAAPEGTGYWLVTQDSEVYAFGSVYGRIGDFAMLTAGKVVEIVPDPARPQPLPVAVVGDSLVWQAENTIIHTFEKDGHIKAKIVANPGHALSSTWVQTKLVQAEGTSNNQIFVIETASNDAAQVSTGRVPLATYEKDLERVISRSNGRCVVVVSAKTFAPFYYTERAADLVNGVNDRMARRFPNVRVVEWERLAAGHASWFAPDHLHFAPKLPADAGLGTPPPGLSTQTPGEVAFAKALVRGIQSCPALS